MAITDDIFDIRMLCVEEGIIIHSHDNDETDPYSNFTDLDSLAIGGRSHD